jgi:hypothetical protein
MKPRTRKLALVAHVGASVGWIGAIVASLVLGAAALFGDLSLTRAAYVALRVIGWYALVPCSVLSLVTGLIQSLGTQWGLLRHYWVIVKLAMNLFATAVLLLYMQTLDALASMTSNGELMGNPSPVTHAAGALALLVAALVLSVFKPRGLTRYGQRRSVTARASRTTATA